MSRRSSGSMTVFRASRTCSRVGIHSFWQKAVRGKWLLTTNRGLTSCETPAVEGGEGAAFAGEGMRPANLSRHVRSPRALGGGSCLMRWNSVSVRGDPERTFVPRGGTRVTWSEQPRPKGYQAL